MNLFRGVGLCREVANLRPNPKDVAAPSVLSLNSWERQRSPLSTDFLPENHMTRISTREINVELTCPVCLDLFRGAMTLKDCLHRFCKVCIDKSLRIGNKECPVCRQHYSSKRSLRSDATVDQLIQILYPNRNENHQSLFEEVDAESAQLAAIQYQQRKVHETLVERTLRKEKELEDIERQKRPKRSRIEEKKPNKSRSNFTSRRHVDDPPPRKEKVIKPVEKRDPAYMVDFDGDFNEISFAIRRHPNERKLEALLKEYIRTTPTIQVRQLKLYIAKKIGFQHPDQILLGTTFDPYECIDMQLPPDNFNLIQLNTSNPTFQKSKMLYYMLKE